MKNFIKANFFQKNINNRKTTICIVKCDLLVSVQTSKIYSVIEEKAKIFKINNFTANSIFEKKNGITRKLSFISKSVANIAQ